MVFETMQRKLDFLPLDTTVLKYYIKRQPSTVNRQPSTVKRQPLNVNR